MEKNDPNQKFGLSADQIAKLAGLKKTLPEKEEEKVDSPAEREEIKIDEKQTVEEKLSPEEEEIVKLGAEFRILEKKFESAEIGKDEKIKIQNLMDENKLRAVRFEEKSRGIKFDLKDVAELFDKTPEETEKAMERIEGKKEIEKIPEKEIKEAKKDEPKETAAKKPAYSEKYLLSTIEESRIIGDKKLEAYYKSELDKYNKTKTAERPVIEKSEQTPAEIRRPADIPVKINMPKFEQPPMAPKENPAEEMEKESGEGLSGAIIEDSVKRVQKALGKKGEQEKSQAEKPKEKAEEEKSEKPKKEKSVKNKKEKLTEVEKEAEKIAKQVGKEGLFGKEAGEKADSTDSPREEEIPLGAEAFVRPMGEEKKKPLIERTEEEKKERAAEFKKFQEMKKTRADYADKAKDYYKYQTILGKFKKVFGGKEEAAKVTEEFEAARIKYEKAQAEFNGEKLIRHNVEERRRVDEINGARAKENSTFEKFRAAYRWLGDQNLEKVIKPEAKIGKIICRMASLRTVVGLGLGVSGVGLALSGGTAMAVGSALFLRKLYSGAASGLGTYEGLRMLAEKKTAIDGEEIKNLDLKSANEKMAQIESWAILNGKKIMEYSDYVKIRDRRTELLVGEKSVKLSEVMAGQFAKMNEEIDKRNRGEMYRKTAALGMGVFVGSGAMAWAFKKALYGVGIIGETPAPGAKPEIIPKGTDVIKESYVETAGKGSSVWKMTEHQLQAHFGERFNGLNAAQKTYLIDYYKDIVAKNPKVFGLADIDVVTPGQKINFAPLFTDTANFEKGIGKALKLTFAETQNILSNNKLLREWVLSHPGERLTSARVEELLKMPKGTMAEHFANDNMIVKPSGVTVDEIIAEQEKMRTAEIVGGMEDRAVARILNNTIQESGLTFEEYRAIKGVSVKQLLEQAKWDNWKAGTVDLPHDGIYGGTEFARQLKLAEAIRSLNPSGGQLDMSVEDYLKGAIKEGKFSSRGAIEVPSGPAVLEGSPAEIEARPRGISPVESEIKPRGAAAGVEAAAESKPKIVEAAAETKVAAGRFPSVELSTGERLEFVYNNEGNPVGFSELNAVDFEGGRELLNEDWRESVRGATKGMMNKQLYLTQVETQAAKIASWQKILEALPKDSQEASFLRNHIAKTIGNIEKRYGDVFK